MRRFIGIDGWKPLAVLAMLALLWPLAVACDAEFEKEPPPPDDSLLTLERAYPKQKLSNASPAEYRFRTIKRGAYLIMVSDNPLDVPIRIRHPKRTCVIEGNGSCELVSSPDETYDFRITTTSEEEVEFTLLVSHTEGRGLFQGEVSTPVSLRGGSAHIGSIGVKESSFYQFITEEGGPYIISVSGTHSDLLWRLFDASAFDVVLQECDFTPGAGSEVCETFNLHPNTRYYVKVEEMSGVPGDYYLSIYQ